MTLYCNQIFLFKILHQLYRYLKKYIYKETHFCQFIFLEISHQESPYPQCENVCRVSSWKQNFSLQNVSVIFFPHLNKTRFTPPPHPSRVLPKQDSLSQPFTTLRPCDHSRLVPAGSTVHGLVYSSWSRKDHLPPYEQNHTRVKALLPSYFVRSR